MRHADAREKNIAMLQLVAERMGEAREQVVFLGSTVIPYLLTREASFPLRRGKDVDFIFDYSSKEELHDFEDALWERGFIKMRTGVVSQWSFNGVDVDMLPTGAVLGFCNQWCDEAVRNSVRVDIGKGMTINMIPAPCFLGAKLDKFANRDDDYTSSRDIYDLLLVMAGRPDIEAEVAERASRELRRYLCTELAILLTKGNDLALLVRKYSNGEVEDGECLALAFSRIRRIIDNMRRVS